MIIYYHEYAVKRHILCDEWGIYYAMTAPHIVCPGGVGHVRPDTEPSGTPGLSLRTAPCMLLLHTEHHNHTAYTCSSLGTCHPSQLHLRCSCERSPPRSHLTPTHPPTELTLLIIPGAPQACIHTSVADSTCLKKSVCKCGASVCKCMHMGQDIGLFLPGVW